MRNQLTADYVRVPFDSRMIVVRLVHMMFTVAGGVIIGVLGLYVLGALFGTPEGRIVLGALLKISLVIALLSVVALSFAT